MAHWSPSRLTPAQLEERRRSAARLLRAGQAPAAVARHLGVSRTSVGRWQRALEQTGLRGLRRRPHPGRPPRLGQAEWHHLATILTAGAVAAGFDTERWTLRRITAVVRREFGVTYHLRSFGRALHAHGWSPQRPIPRARERDDALVRAWIRAAWPALKKKPAAATGSSPSSTRRDTRSGRPSARRGRPAGTPR